MGNSHSKKAKEIKTIEDISFDETNINKGREYGNSLLEKSLRDNGFGRSILADKNGILISGNKTFEQATQIGLEKVKVIQTTGDEIVVVQRTDLDINSKQGVELKILDNTVSKHNYNEDLETAAKLIDELDLDIDMSTLGMDIKGISLDIEEDNFDVPVPIIPKTKKGDFYEIGKHRLLCGDCTNKADVKRLFGDKSFDLCITDPPYGVSYTGKTKNALKIENDSLTEEETHKLFEDALLQANVYANEGASIYASVPAGLLQVGFMQVMHKMGLLRQCLIWDKTQMVLGHSDYHYQHEPILYGWFKGSHYFTSDRTKTTVIAVKKPSASREHPTMKPLELWCELIQNSSKESDICFDCFGGSGTTIVSCEKTNRIGYSIEISEKYCDVIITRMINHYKENGEQNIPIKKNGILLSSDEINEFTQV